MSRITVLGICTMYVGKDDVLIPSPAYIHIRCLQDPKKNPRNIMVPLAELKGTMSEIRKSAHEMVDRALDAFEEDEAMKAPAGIIVVRDEREEV